MLLERRHKGVHYPARVYPVGARLFLLRMMRSVIASFARWRSTIRTHICFLLVALSTESTTATYLNQIFIGQRMANRNWPFGHRPIWPCSQLLFNYIEIVRMIYRNYSLTALQKLCCGTEILGEKKKAAGV